MHTYVFSPTKLHMGNRMWLLWILIAIWLCCAMVFPLYMLVKALYRPRLRTSARRIMRS
jgi:hypothetical protein